DLAHREHHPVPVKEIPAKDAPCKEVILKGDEADLDLLPVLTLNEGDAGAYINAAALIYAPASPSLRVSTGSRSRSASSPFRITSLHGASFAGISFTGTG